MKIFEKNIFLFLLLICFINFVSSLSLDLSIPKEYSEVVSGESVYFQINVKYPENTLRQDLVLEYKILDENGKVLARLETLKAIETQFSLFESIVVPKDLVSGMYVLNVQVSSGGILMNEINTSFNVVDEKESLLVIFLIIFLGAVIFGIIIYLISFLKILWNKFMIKIKVRRIVKKRFQEVN